MHALDSNRILCLLSMRRMSLSFDAADIGRRIVFGHGANTGALTVIANDTLTVATVAGGGSTVDLAGDYIECNVLTATLVTCASFAQ